MFRSGADIGVGWREGCAVGVLLLEFWSGACVGMLKVCVGDPARVRPLPEGAAWALAENAAAGVTGEGAVAFMDDAPVAEPGGASVETLTGAEFAPRGWEAVEIDGCLEVPL